jgi:hypothetical protein
MPRTVPVPPAVALALVLAGCPDNVKDPFPKEVGYQPLMFCASVAAPAWPDPVGSDPYPEVLSLARVANCGGALNADEYVVTDQAMGRGYLKFPILAVWAKLRDPNVMHLCLGGTAVDCVDRYEVLPGLESSDFPVSFRIKYHVDSEIIAVAWEHTWRQGPLAGTVDAPQAVGARYQKTWGIENIRVQTASFVLRPSDTDPNVTSFEMVAWLDADRSNENTVAGTVTNAYNALWTALHAAP